jgi:hypothetical protein
MHDPESPKHPTRLWHTPERATTNLPDSKLGMDVPGFISENLETIGRLAEALGAF